MKAKERQENRGEERKAVTNKNMIYESHPSVLPSGLIMYARQRKRESEKTNEAFRW